MYTWLSVDMKVGRSLTSRRIVCWLSQWMVISWPRSNPRSLKIRFHQRASVAACDKASSSASVVDVETVFCLVELQSMGPPNSLKRYPSELRRVVVQFPNPASLAIPRTFSFPGQAIVNSWLLADAEYSMA